MSRLHDLVIRIISEYLRENKNNITPDLSFKIIAEYQRQNNIIFVNLLRLNSRFYGIRDIFIKEICLSENPSSYALDNKPYNWNKVRLINLVNSKISDVSALRTCHSVELFSCHYISDVSPLGKCHSVSICCCFNIDNVSGLGKCRYVTLSFCNSIRDFSSLSTCHSLTIKYCHGLTDISALDNVPKLRIENCGNVTRFPHPPPRSAS